MTPVRLRIWTWKSGSEISHIWSFTPLRAPRNYSQARDSGNDGEGRMRRRPFNIRESLQIKLPAGLLLGDTDFRNFLRLLMSHKIELQRTIAGQEEWVEYDLDLAGDLPDPERPNNIDRLRGYTVKLVEAQPSAWYDDFEDAIDNFVNG